MASRPLEPMYPVIFSDALRVKIRDEATVRSRAIYLVLAVLPDGSRDIRGLWIERTAGAKFWIEGLQRPEIARLPGHPHCRHRRSQRHAEALTAVFRATTLLTCIVHLLRASLDFANWQERKPMAKALRPIYTAVNVDATSAAQEDFARGPWSAKFPTVVAAWRRARTHRRVIYTTNALENVRAQLRRSSQRASIFRATRRRRN